MCKYKDRDFAYRLQPKDSATLYNELMDLFKTKLELISYSELLEKQNDVAAFYSPRNDEWSSIKKKNIKEMYIERFAISQKITHSLTVQQTQHLINVIFLAFIYKIITPSDIFFVNGEIDHINGFEFSEKKIILKRNIYDIQVNIAPEIVVDRKLLSEEWDKFLISLRKISWTIKI